MSPAHSVPGSISPISSATQPRNPRQCNQITSGVAGADPRSALRGRRSSRRLSLAHATNRAESRLLAIVAGALVIAALYFARNIFVPLALAILLSLLLTPAVQRLERWRVPRILAITLVVSSLIAAVAFAIWETSPQFADFIDNLPSYEKSVQEKIDVVKGATGQRLANATDSIRALANEIAGSFDGKTQAPTAKKSSQAASPQRPMPVEVEAPSNPIESVRTIFGPLAAAVIVIVFAVFILLGREDLRNRFIRLAYGGRLSAMTQAMDEAVSRIDRYLMLQLLVNCTFGLLVWLGLHFIGIPNAALWGLCAAVLRYLPYIGAPSAAILPIFLSIAVYPGWTHALLTAGLFLFLEIGIANFVEPMLYSSHVGLSPLAILVAAVFWTLIWGFPGLVLSTPLTVCLVVIGRYVPSLEFLDVLLGNEPVLPPHAQYYQRLLAGDQNEARQIAEAYLKSNDLPTLYGKLMIPALGLAEQDRHRDQLDADTSQFVYQSTREIVDEISEMDDDEEPLPSHLRPGQRFHFDVLCVPARDDADEVVAGLLARLLEAQHCRARTLALAGIDEMIEKVGELVPGVVAISALPPFALNHSRVLYGKLRSRYPGLKVVVCLWHFEGDLQRVSARLRLAKDHRLFTMLTEVLEFFDGKPKPKEKIAAAESEKQKLIEVPAEAPKESAAESEPESQRATSTSAAANSSALRDESEVVAGETSEPMRPNAESVLTPEPVDLASESSTPPEPVREPEPNPTPTRDPKPPSTPKREPGPKPAPQRDPAQPPDNDPAHEPVQEPEPEHQSIEGVKR